jgi:proteasome lid subunit RPN8/RPN11|nr:putative peptidase [uncultured Mediterranean phage uvMED]BAR21865.1 putative peptidase [uncultured Mediterranean phage uvMED]BAR21877.1 putative peptidase [uncultured Mediterranean phage uvMED]
MNWKEAALAHAKDQDPKECCGLLLNIRGKERYHPCRNLSAQSDEYFILDPEDYIKGSNLGEITAIIHSHPDTPPVASQADKMSCEQTKLPWYIVNPKTETWGYYEPCGYEAPLLGRPWVWAVTDCWSLVVDWYKKEKGIKLLDYERPTRIEDFTDDPVFERYLPSRGFRLLRPEEPLINGDVLAMSILGKGLNHVAIFIDGDVLHHSADRLSCREPYSPWLLKCTGGRYRYAA